MRSPLAILSLVSLLAGDARAAVVCAGGSTVLGVDVSHYQGSINWPAVKAAGRDFAIASVGDGTYQDPNFAGNWSGMKAAGIIRGAYQFFEPGEDAATQANILIGKVGALGDGDLPATLDVEATGGQSAGTIAARIQTWVDLVTAGTGKAPIIYTGKYFWNGNVVSSAFSSLPLWIAAYGVSCPDTPNPWGGWSFWQYTDAAQVGGISGGVDGDQFNGTLADLQALAGGGPDWSAGYVAQSWPLASTAVHLVTNQRLPAAIELRNDGRGTWDGNTRLGTTEPRDRMSAFVSGDWLAPNRAAAVSGTVAPGGSFNFQFTFRAPMQPGDYHEFFTLVQEGTSWFSDPGQGGPADHVIEAWIVVDPADWAAELGQVSFDPLVQLAVGGTVNGWVELKNVGNKTWPAGVVKLAPTPRDQDSPLAAASWLSPTRAATLAADVPPGATGRFDFALTGSSVGMTTATFGLVAEGVTWFADAPAGGGPDDDQVALAIQVGDGSAGSPGPGGTGGVGSGGGGSGGGSDPGGTPPSDGCSLAPHAPLPTLPLFLIAGALAVVSLRRRS